MVVLIDENMRRFAKYQDGDHVLTNFTGTKKSGWVTYDGTTAVGKRGLNGIDLCGGGSGGLTLSNGSLDCTPFKIGVCKSVSGAADITVDTVTLTGSTLPAKNLPTPVPNSTIGAWNIGGAGCVATWSGANPSVFTTAKSGTWV